MICTTAFSSIESTLANFTDDIEKEEVVAFKAYLQLAIANFAAVDTSPNLPKIPLHSRPKKDISYGVGKDKTAGNKIAVAVPRNILSTESSAKKVQETFSLSKTPKAVENTWATVARKGMKKARVTLNTEIQVASVRKPAQSVTNKDKPTSSASSSVDTSDRRLFVRLPQEHEWRKLSPAGIRESIVRKLSISPALIGKIKPVRSGFALSPCSTEAREAILNAGNGLFLSGAKLEPATNWASVLIPTVPSSIRKEHGEVEISSSLLSDEIERVCSMRPVYVKLYGRNKPEAPHRTWMAFFLKTPRIGFRVFDESGIARSFKKQHPLQFCKRCNGHHPDKNCSRAPSCSNCGSTNHATDACKAATKCRNCGGPHRSDSRRCLARPTRSGAPTKEQMKIYRQAGDREYQAVLRARAAEEIAATVESMNIDLTNSPLPEADNNTDNTQASPVEDSTVDARRL